MRKDHKKSIKKFHSDGFSVSELAIMYHVSERRIELILEEDSNES